LPGGRYDGGAGNNRRDNAAAHNGGADINDNDHGRTHYYGDGCADEHGSACDDDDFERCTIHNHGPDHDERPESVS
jgi:hypothetical protein